MQVAVLEKDRYDEIVETLWDAFRDYPVMRFVVGEAGDEYDDRGRRLVGYLTESRLARGWPVLGVSEGDRLGSAGSPVEGGGKRIDRETASSRRGRIDDERGRGDGTDIPGNIGDHEPDTGYRRWWRAGGLVAVLGIHGRVFDHRQEFSLRDTGSQCGWQPGHGVPVHMVAGENGERHGAAGFSDDRSARWSG